MIASPTLLLTQALATVLNGENYHLFREVPARGGRSRGRVGSIDLLAVAGDRAHLLLVEGMRSEAARQPRKVAAAFARLGAFRPVPPTGSSQPFPTRGIRMIILRGWTGAAVEDPFGVVPFDSWLRKVKVQPGLAQVETLSARIHHPLEGLRAEPWRRHWLMALYDEVGSSGPLGRSALDAGPHR